MKKIILMSCLLATLIANHSFAACNSGTMVDGRICVSKEGTVLHGMNWWSAYSGCEAQGMKMPSIYDLCPTWDGAFNSDQCEKKVLAQLYGQVPPIKIVTLFC